MFFRLTPLPRGNIHAGKDRKNLFIFRGFIILYKMSMVISKCYTYTSYTDFLEIGFFIFWNRFLNWLRSLQTRNCGFEFSILLNVFLNGC